jgi:4-diphosphocytidyl-2-C-methyl-D-erythritol kinase
VKGAQAAQVAAQAKINVFLNVLAREDNGYHQIETLFLRIGLSDMVRVRRTPQERSLDVTGDVDLSGLGDVENNLAWRAAEAFAAASEWRGGFAIEIVKHIPIGGGLGGGSADAGAVLRVMNALAEHPLELLDNLATPLGADVPFLAGESACSFGWGRGERTLALTPPPSRELALAIPDFAVNTAQAYGWLDERGPRPVMARELKRETLANWSTLAQVGGNVLQPVVAKRHPAIDNVTRLLDDSEALIARMSGSGSVVFGVFDRAADRDAAAQLIEAAGVHVVRSRTCTHVESVLPIE